MAAQPALISPEEYLRREQAAEIRHEYVAGFVYAMAGGSFDHGVIVSNLGGVLYNGLRDRGCRHFIENIKVWIAAESCYYYPDALVCCPANVLSRSQGIVDNPTAIFEVMSESTASLDEGAKFAAYRTLSSVRDYILIDSRSRHVRIFSREGKDWVVRTYGETGDFADVPSIEITLPLAQLYDGAELPAG